MQAQFEAQVKQFLACKEVAIIGYSHDDQQPANAIYKRMRTNGYSLHPVNPNPTGFADAVTVYASVEALPEAVCAAVICTPPQQTLATLKALHTKGIHHAWIHKGLGEGSYIQEAEAFAQDNAMALIPDGCPLMFIDPDFFHGCLKTCLSWFGKLTIDTPPPK